jgi:hypothetical protein
VTAKQKDQLEDQLANRGCVFESAKKDTKVVLARQSIAERRFHGKQMIGLPVGGLNSDLDRVIGLEIDHIEREIGRQPPAIRAVKDRQSDRGNGDIELGGDVGVNATSGVK